MVSMDTMIEMVGEGVRREREGRGEVRIEREN